jgi:hypothetical protein
MVEFKYWDVALAVFGFLIQCGLAWLGLTLTHWKHKAAFFGLVVLGAVFTGVAVKRGIDSAGQVQAQLNTIQENTEKPQLPPQVTINTPQPDKHTHISFMQPMTMGIPSQIISLPFTKDEKIGLNIGFFDAGEFSVADSKLRALIFLASEIPGKGKIGNWQMVKRQIPLNHIVTGPVLLPHISPVSYFSFFHADLTEQQANDLNSGTDQLCVAGFVTWKDETGNYETDLFQCGYMQATGGFNWHTHAETDSEHKL